MVSESECKILGERMPVSGEGLLQYRLVFMSSTEYQSLVAGREISFRIVKPCLSILLVSRRFQEVENKDKKWTYRYPK